MDNKNNVLQFYVELNKFVQNDNYEKAIKVSNKILNLEPQHFKAFHYKIVCLIHLSRFDEAITVITKNAQFSDKVRFEKAYCYYRLNKHEESLKEIDRVEQKSARDLELRAQILYRMEMYDKAYTTYHKLTKNVHDDYDEERSTNLTAILSHVNTPNAINDLQYLSENTYESCFNKACVLISHNLLNEAEKKLRQCEKLCKEFLEDEEASEEEISVELALIRVQMAYVYQRQNRIKEAHSIYASNLKYRLKDVALLAVASNNIVCINKDQNLFDSKKKMRAAQNDTLVYKLPSSQRKFIALNNAILHYYMNHYQQCEQLCATIEHSWPELITYTIVLRALTKIKGNQVMPAIELIEKCQSKDADQLFLKLFTAHLYLTQGDKQKACNILENLGENTYRPGIVGALTTLYLAFEDESKALKLFENILNWYKSKEQTKDVDLRLMWRQAADFHIKSGHPHVAANSLDELLRIDKNDKRAVAQLILACLQFDEKRAKALSDQLPSVSEICAGLDVSLLQISQMSAVNTKKSPTVKETQQETPKVELVTKKQKPRKRKSKLPKNIVEGVPPDPERWLPKYERTGFRRKKDKRVKDVIKGSQGTTSIQAEQYDFSSKVVELESDVTVVSPSTKNKAPHQVRKGQTNKKKNKRR